MSDAASWYPGHMVRARRLIRENLPRVDTVVEVADARVPVTSRAPDLGAQVAGKRTLLILNKADLADPGRTAFVVRGLRAQGQAAVAVDSRRGAGVAEAVRLLTEPEKRVRRRDVRCMVVGLPNVGKSSFINRVAGKRAAASADRPGLTRGVQWIRLARGVDLLDTPGILWPRGLTGEDFYKLAVCGIAGSYDEVEAAVWLWDWLARHRPGVLTAAADAYAYLDALGRSRGFLGSGGRVDLTKAAHALLRDFRSGRLGRLTLDQGTE